MNKHLLYVIKVCFTLLLLTPQTMHADVVYRGSVEVEYGKTTTVTLPDFLITEYNYNSAAPYGGGGTLSWSVSNSNLIIEGTANFSCRIRPRSGSVFPSYVTLTAQFYSWYGTTLKTIQAEWTVRLKEKAPDPIPVTKISLSPSSTSLKIGKQIQISATVSPSSATDKSVSWSTSNSSVATVSSSGLVKAEGAGTATITCRANDGSGVQATCNVTVSEPVTISINSTNFPDDNFRNFLLEQSYGKDGVLTEGEISTIKSIDVHEKNISSLKGIEYFTSLKTLYCINNLLTALDVSKNTALTNLTCYNNQLTTLDVSKNTALTILWCHRNQLTALDVSKNTALTQLICHSNQLTALDVSKDTALTELDCSSNQLTVLDVSKNTALPRLTCNSNQLTTLDVSKNTALTILWCYGNQLTALDVSKNTALIELDCHYNQLTALDVSKNTALTELDCSSNQLTVLDVSKNTVLTRLLCDYNQLTTLDVSKNVALKDLYCYKNQLMSLDVSKNIALTCLFCSSNQLTTLDVSKNAELETLSVFCNKIKGTAMDALINSFPINAKTTKQFHAIAYDQNDEENVCTKLQVAAAKAKGWTPEYWDITAAEWKEYEGSEDTSIATKISLPVSQTVNVGSTLQLTPTIEPATAEATLTWTTDDASIAKVTSTGMVFGSKEGTAIITVTTDNGLKAECFVMVQLSSGISSVGADSEDAPVYTLSGQRLAAPQKGINIVGGKKVIIR